MSKFTEYINLAMRGLPHSREILQSVINNVQLKYGTLSEDKKAEIIRRRMICASCPFMSQNVKAYKDYKELTGKEYSSAREFPHCSLCGCPVESKTASLSSNCGIESWNKENTEKTIPLKWTKFEDNGKEKEQRNVDQENSPQ